jgi:hypothetical protein
MQKKIKKLLYSDWNDFFQTLLFNDYLASEVRIRVLLLTETNTDTNTNIRVYSMKYHQHDYSLLCDRKLHVSMSVDQR